MLKIWKVRYLGGFQASRIKSEMGYVFNIWAGKYFWGLRRCWHVASLSLLFLQSPTVTGKFLFTIMNWYPSIYCCSSPPPTTTFLPGEYIGGDRKPRFQTGGGPAFGEGNLVEASLFTTVATSFLPSIANVPTITWNNNQNMSIHISTQNLNE